MHEGRVLRGDDSAKVRAFGLTVSNDRCRHGRIARPKRTHRLVRTAHCTRVRKRAHGSALEDRAPGRLLSRPCGFTR
jgi:hypothetical protein